MRAGIRWLARSVPRHWLLRPILLIGIDGTLTAASFWLANWYPNQMEPPAHDKNT